MSTLLPALQVSRFLHFSVSTHPVPFQKINDNGYVVWTGDDGSDWEVFLYDGTSITQISNNTHLDQVPQVNINGQVVWAGGYRYGLF